MKKILLIPVLAALLCGCQKQKQSTAPAPVTWEYASFKIVADPGYQDYTERNYIMFLLPGADTNTTDSSAYQSPLSHWSASNVVHSVEDVLNQAGEYGWDLIGFDPASQSYIVKRPADQWTNGTFLVFTVMEPKNN